jgi:hypothetical protein
LKWDAHDLNLKLFKYESGLVYKQQASCKSWKGWLLIVCCKLARGGEKVEQTDR